MNKHVTQLMQYPPHILRSRISTLQAEIARKRESKPVKFFAFAAALFSLFSMGVSTGFHSLAFVISCTVIVGFTAVQAVGAISLVWNLRDSTSALEQVTR